LPRLSDKSVSGPFAPPSAPYDQAMSFGFATRPLPMSLRVCRSLVWAQAAYTVMAGLFVLLITGLLGSGSAIPFHDGTLSGEGAILLGLSYVAAGLALAWLAVLLGRLVSWARAGVVSMEVFLALLQLFRAFDLSVSTVISVLLSLGIVVLLFAPGTERALGGPAQA
jgi:hypothetical protein